MSDERWFERLADTTREGAAEHAPARLKSRVYSALVSHLGQSSGLLSLTATKQAGHQLCVFENMLTVLPVGDDIRSMNPCRICHARVLGERIEHAPIFWPGCPYSEFHNG